MSAPKKDRSLPAALAEKAERAGRHGYVAGFWGYRAIPTWVTSSALLRRAWEAGWQEGDNQAIGEQRA